jgi:hypothetical protein
MQRRPALRALVVTLAAAALVPAAPAGAWFTVGHARVARAAVRALPPSLPRFFRHGGWTIGEAAVDPDLVKEKTLPALRAAEEPQHYIDLELLQGAPLPPDRWAFVAMAGERRLDPKKVGILPYSVLEGVQRLAMTFAEYRHFPDHADIQQKALVYAGLLAHYAGDLEQPLHTSIHHDGRALPDNSSPFTGVHQLVDGLFERVPFDETAATRQLTVTAFPDSWTAIQAELASSHALVDRIYELEPALRGAFPPPPAPPMAAVPAAPGSSPAPMPPPIPIPRPAPRKVTVRPPVPPEVTAFTVARYRATAAFLASLYRTAWEQSAAIQLPSWLERPAPPRIVQPARTGTHNRP